ncbi:hypothetical protein K491DRAFT_598045 [Lophiostoma macrostomum CBS 122681]|uniref:Uncharacterized protein n=1 Tax=Lophiostoma macrostomum CBS 122681 TaxID=1314788 RepID=A0A6A6T7U5_9PLEO|nr:hypothetical protein K491DRAFT_598045 [Lophiostoma macrostomum CBS 122681]
MPRGITNNVFSRTSLTTCDIFIMALGLLESKQGISPEEFVDSLSPWFIDAETVWWRKFVMGFR